ncbi:Small ubiquitin-related modifier 4 [Linum perenne]
MAKNCNGNGGGASSSPANPDSIVIVKVKGPLVGHVSFCKWEAFFLFVSQDGELLRFKSDLNNPIKDVLVTYCKNRSLDFKLMRFIIDQKDFDYRKTPAQLGLKNNDLIVGLMTTDGG